MLGRIVKGAGGFFHVRVEDGDYRGDTIVCNSKGIFRKYKIKPLPGDLTEIEINAENRDDDETTGIITQIYDRKNSLKRPSAANLDKLFIAAAVKSPVPDLYFVDKLTAIAVNNGISPIIIVNKTDLADPSEILEIYSKTEFTIIPASIHSGAGRDEIRAEIADCVCVFSGMSGVGKSSIINTFFPELNLAQETGTLSKRIDRGRHTTRTAELFPFDGGYIADTPGFNMLDFESNIILAKGETLNLIECFPDLFKFTETCKFKKCTHTKEDGCAVLEAVVSGNAAASRHESYLTFYSEMKAARKW